MNHQDYIVAGKMLAVLQGRLAAEDGANFVGPGFKFVLHAKMHVEKWALESFRVVIGGAA